MKMDAKDQELNPVPTFWQLENHLKRRLIREFSAYVYGCIKFKHWVMFFSFWALAFQTRTLLGQYLEFDTVVKVEMKKWNYVPMPGVTICTDPEHMVVKAKLLKRYPQIQEEIDQQNLTKAEEIHVYRRYKEIAFRNSTIDQWFQLMVEPQMVLDCRLTRNTVYHSKRELPPPDCYNMSQILYSLPLGAGLCWTFFSQVNPRDYKHRDWVMAYNWYNITVELGILASFYIHFKAFNDDEFVWDEKIQIDETKDGKPELGAIINYHKAVYPIISLDRAELKAGTNYEIMYSQTNSRLLNVPYNTDCRDYEIEVPFKSNYECIDDCLTQHMIQDCGCHFSISRGERVTKWPADNSSEGNLPICQENKEGNQTCDSNSNFHDKYDRSECQLRKKCKNNCLEEYYRYEVKQTFWDEEIDGNGMPENEDDEYFYENSTQPEYTKAKHNDTFATLRIRRKDEPDTTYEHSADMIFVEFVCYFGGLLGLWLGISMLDVYNQCIIWYGEAPGEYRKWLERQKIIESVEPIKIESDGRVSVINHQINGINTAKHTNDINGNRKNSGNSNNIYSTQYSNFGTRFE